MLANLLPNSVCSNKHKQHCEVSSLPKREEMSRIETIGNRVEEKGNTSLLKREGGYKKSRIVQKKRKLNSNSISSFKTQVKQGPTFVYVVFNR